MNEPMKNLFKAISVYKRLIYGLLLVIAVAMVIYLNYQGVLSPKMIFLYLQEHGRTAPIGASVNDFMMDAQSKIFSENILLIGIGVTFLVILKMLVAKKSKIS